MLQRTYTAFIAGVALGLLIVGSLLITETRIHEPEREAEPSEEAAHSFVDAWQRMKTGKWTVVSEFVRSNETGQMFSFEMREIQDPPRRARVSGATTIELPDRIITCPPKDEAHDSKCREVSNRQSFGESVQSEMSAVRGLVLGPERRYDVNEKSGNCYDLHARTDVAGAWGRQSTFCFDGRTGALSSSETVQVTSTNRVVSKTTAVAITGDIKDSDFEPPQ